MTPMAVTTTTTPTYSRPMVLLAGLGGVAMAATFGLWAYYGTAVFYETIVAGINACF